MMQANAAILQAYGMGGALTGYRARRGAELGVSVVVNVQGHAVAAHKLHLYVVHNARRGRGGVDSNGVAYCVGLEHDAAVDAQHHFPLPCTAHNSARGASSRGDNAGRQVL